METKILEIVNTIRGFKGLDALIDINYSDSLRDKIGFSSFDLADLTVRIEDEFDVDIFEDGIISTVGEIFERLKK